jgi:transposase-like protein
MADNTQGEGADVRRWTAKRKAALVLDILQGKRAVAEVSRQYDLTPSEIEEWVEEARRGMENALRARPRDVRAEYEGRIKELQAKVGELVLENDALKKLSALRGLEDEK